MRNEIIILTQNKKTWIMFLSSGSITSNNLPDLLRMNQNKIKGKIDTGNNFNNHFISAGSGFRMKEGLTLIPCDPDQQFTFAPILTSQVSLMSLDVKKIFRFR